MRPIVRHSPNGSCIVFGRIILIFLFLPISAKSDAFANDVELMSVTSALSYPAVFSLTISGDSPVFLLFKVFLFCAVGAELFERANHFDMPVQG